MSYRLYFTEEELLMLGKMQRFQDDEKKRYWGSRGEPDLVACWLEIWGVVRRFSSLI